MADTGATHELTDEERQRLLDRLGSPFGFLGAQDIEVVEHAGQRLDVQSIVARASAEGNDRPVTDALQLLKGWLDDVHAELAASKTVEDGEARLEHGLAIRRAIHVLRDRLAGDAERREEDERVDDAKRWLSFGKKLR